MKLMAAMFETSVPNISMHIRNLFAEGEPSADAVVKESLTTRRKELQHVFESDFDRHIKQALAPENKPPKRRPKPKSK